MEKIIPQQKKDAMIFVSVTFPLAIIFYFYGIKKQAIIGMLFTIALMFVLKIIYDFFYHSRIRIGEEGILLKSFLRTRMVPWEHLTITVKKLNKDQKKFIFSCEKETLITLKIDYLNDYSLINLTKKYCPQNHQLYILVEEFAKEKRLPF